MNLAVLWELLPTLCKVARWVTRRKPRQITLLIVEDDANDAELLKFQLTRRGLLSEWVQSGEEATAILRHTHYPLVFVDMRLPRMSGQELLHWLSRNAPRVNTVIVCGEPYDLKDLPQSQFVSVIRKPATLDALEEMLQKLKI